MKFKSTDDCTSASCNDLPSAKSPSKNRIEISDTPAENTPKEIIIEPKMPFMGPIITTILEKTKVTLTWFEQILKKNQKYNTANSTEEKNEKNQKKVQDREEKLETISTKPSDTNADVTKRVYVIGGSIVKHIRDYELSQWMANCKIFVKSFSAAKVTCI